MAQIRNTYSVSVPIALGIKSSISPKIDVGKSPKIPPPTMKSLLAHLLEAFWGCLNRLSFLCLPLWCFFILFFLFIQDLAM